MFVIATMAAGSFIYYILTGYEGAFMGWLFLLCVILMFV